MNMRLIHYSADPALTLGSLESREQQTVERWHKPNGFWVSVESGDDGWLTWCRENEFRIGAFAYLVEIANGANLLYLSTAAAIRAFTDNFRSQPDETWTTFFIDWERVAEAHQGMIIAPYQYSCRFDHRTDWYYPWDCASGCIWDIHAIAAIVRAPELDPQIPEVEIEAQMLSKNDDVGSQIARLDQEQVEGRSGKP